MMSSNSEDGVEEPPAIANESAGSSVSSNLLTECDELVRLTIDAIAKTRNADEAKSRKESEVKAAKSHQSDIPERVGTDTSSTKSKVGQQKTEVPSNPEDLLHTHTYANMIDSRQRFEEELLLLEPSGKDEEIDRLENIVDGWSFDLKRNIMAEYNQTKYKLKGLVRKLIEEERLRLHDTVRELRDQVVSLQDLVRSYQETVRRKDEVIGGLSKEIAKQRDRVLLAHKFANWRQLREERRREEFCLALAARYHSNSVKRRAWLGWRSVIERPWQERIERRCEVQAREVCERLAEENDREREAMLQEMSLIREEARLAEQGREVLEAEMRKALMRGVSALNMEAMTVLGPGPKEQEGAGHPLRDGPTNDVDGVPRDPRSNLGTHNSLADTSLRTSMELEKRRAHMTQVELDRDRGRVPTVSFENCRRTNSSAPDQGRHHDNGLLDSGLGTKSGNLLEEIMSDYFPRTPQGQPTRPSHTVPTSMRRPTTRVTSGAGSSVLTVQATAPTGSACPSSATAASVLIERHQPVNKRTQGPVVAANHQTNSKSHQSINHDRPAVCRRIAGQPYSMDY